MEAVGSASETRDQFLQLLVTQLRHQDPLEPTKQEDFLAQLAQFSTLEGIEKLNQNVESFLHSQTENQSSQSDVLTALQQSQSIASAANLVGKEVEFETETGDSATGNVDAIVIADGVISLRVGEDLIPISQVQEISVGAHDATLSKFLRRDFRFE